MKLLSTSAAVGFFIVLVVSVSSTLVAQNQESSTPGGDYAAKQSSSYSAADQQARIQEIRALQKRIREEIRKENSDPSQQGRPLHENEGDQATTISSHDASGGEANAKVSPAEADDPKLEKETDEVVSQLLGKVGPKAVAPSEDDELKALSASVVEAIVSFDGVEDQKKSRALQEDLSQLVQAARDIGRSDAYVAKLIREASQNDLDRIPSAMKTTDSGQLDTNALLISLVANAQRPEDKYVNQLREAAAASAANGAEGANTPGKPITNDVVTVVPGDTLSRIAARKYGDPFLFRRIFDANRDLLSNPNQITVGMKLRLP